MHSTKRRLERLEQRNQPAEVWTFAIDWVDEQGAVAARTPARQLPPALPNGERRFDYQQALAWEDDNETD